MRQIESNEIDASGEVILSKLYRRLSDAGLGVSLTGLNDDVIDTLRRTDLLDRIGQAALFENVREALNAIIYETHDDTDEDPCPLLNPCDSQQQSDRPV